MNNARWSLMFYAAAAFNFLMGGPIFLASDWTYRLAYIGASSPATVRFWGDFGFAVVLIGFGYFIVARDVSRNHGIIWLGVLAKLFDVVALSYRWFTGLAHSIVLVPAAIDGGFLILFLLFFVSRRGQKEMATG